MFKHTRSDFDFDLQKIKGNRKNWKNLKQDKNLIKRELLQVFNKTCYFTDLHNPTETEDGLSKNNSNSLNIEHFIPRNKDKITCKYDFDWNNLFLANERWNCKKGVEIDCKYGIDDFQKWLQWINDPEKYFSYEFDKDEESVKIIPNQNLDFETTLEVVDLLKSFCSIVLPNMAQNLFLQGDLTPDF